MVATKKDKLSGDCLGTGRRKKAIARVRIRSGSGKITVNGREMTEYFPVVMQQQAVLDALDATGKRDQVDCIITCTGGGPNGQAFACKMGISRALIALDGETFSTLRGGGYLTRDSRMKERKKYGLRGARRGVQFSKR
jgi:small subunit ribosomal protein S9